MSGRAHHLRVEHLDSALGLLVREPRLSWRLPERSTVQRAYRIRTSNGWDTGRVASADSILVPYAGPPLGSSQRIGWQLKVWTDLAEADWSAPGWFELGLLDPSDWQADWIGPVEDHRSPAGERPAPLLRGEFSVERPVVAARLHATALGIYEAFLNGRRVGNAELAPGFTQYDSRLQAQTYDVTDQLQAGGNALGVILAEGWYRGLIGITRAADQWGSRLGLLAQLHLTFDDGSTMIIGSDRAWRSRIGHVITADLIAGERWDLRRLPAGWTEPGFDDHDWTPVDLVDAPAARLVGSAAPPVRRVEELTPKSVRRLDEHRQIVDLGQNINGWTKITKLGPAGTTVRLVHGEWLAPDGDVTTDHLRPAVPFLPEPLAAGQIDEVTAAGRPGEVFEPRRTTHGFQYVRVENHPDELTVDDLRGAVVHSDLRRTGWFSCSDDRLNRLHEAATWSLRDNVCDVPTDCPHRERAGWTGDWQLFIPTAAFLYDVAGFSTKWLYDVAADQWPDGTIANISPTARSEGRDSPIAGLNGSAGWEDAVVRVPWELYRAYGDTRILDELWPNMVAWMDKVENQARTGRHPDRAARRPHPAPHERYLRDTGFHWGEWLEPDVDVGDFGAFVAADKGEVATAYFAHSAGLMSRVADVRGDAAAQRRYAELSGNVRAAWQAEYLVDGRLVPDTQANHVRALAFDLLPSEVRPAVAERLIALIRAAGTRLGTGFLATPYLLPVLAEAGHLDVAYELLLSHQEPSWLTMIDRGATTVWERWNGVSADGTPYESLNHYSKGAVISFLHRHVAGIQPLDDGPAYRRFRVCPQPGGGLNWARASHDSPYGLIEVDWRVVDGAEPKTNTERTEPTMEIEVSVPPGTGAELVLPDGSRREVAPGRHRARLTGGIFPP